MSSSKTILAIDDHADVTRALRIAFETIGDLLDVAASPEEALSRLSERSYDAVLLDLNFALGRTDGQEGLACLERILASDPDACVVVITAHSGLRVAITAMQAGARDFVTKPWRNADLIAKVKRAIERTTISRDRESSVARLLSPAGNRGGAVLIGDSPAMVKLRKLIARVAPTTAGIAITGPSGSGRTLVATAIHNCSVLRAGEQFTLDLRDPGSWRQLHNENGTVVLRHADLLDEIAQSKLVEALNPGSRPIAILDNPRRLIPSLRSRIAIVEIEVPSLRNRKQDALLLANHFLRLAAQRNRLPVPKLTRAAEELILHATWPDEARGLARAIERALILSTGGRIDAAALAPATETEEIGRESAAAFDLADNERAIISAALREHHHNVTQAAAALGLSRGSLYRRMERYGL